MLVSKRTGLSRAPIIRSSALGLAAGALGVTELAFAADFGSQHNLPMLLPEDYRIGSDGNVALSIYGSESLMLTQDQYILLDGGLLLVVDELTQATMASFPDWYSSRTQLLSEIDPVRSADGSIVAVSFKRPLWSGTGPRQLSFEELDLQTYEVAQSDPQSDTNQAIVLGLAGAPGAMLLLDMLMTGDQPETVAPPPPPEYNSFAIRIDGAANDDASGYSVGSLNDIDGDGKADLLIGAPYADIGNNEGTTYLVFGSYLDSVREAGQTTIDLATVSSGGGIAIQGIAESYSGWAVSTAGDVDGDGRSDVLIGAPYSDTAGTDAGETFLIFGEYLNDLRNSGITPATVDLGDLSGGKGIALTGIDDDDYSGWSVSNAGDIDGDNLDDIIISAYAADPVVSDEGEAYLVYGSHLKSLRDTNTSTFDLSSLSAATGLVLKGVTTGDEFGWAIRSVGDIDGDGRRELLIAANGADVSGESSVGQVYLIFSSHIAALKLANATELDVNTLDGTTGIRFEGIDERDLAGWGVADAGDIDGDGLAEILIGAPDADLPSGNHEGEVYLIYGDYIKSLQVAGTSPVDLSSLDGVKGLRIDGYSEDGHAGTTVSSAGDVDGDGKSDIIIGAYKLNQPPNAEAGEAYVIFGSYLDNLKNAGTISFGLDNLPLGAGVRIPGIDAEDFLGGKLTSVGSAGDIDGDGKDDVVIGAYGADPQGRTYAGETYLISGHTIDLAADGIGVADAGVIDLVADLGLG